MPDLKSYRLTLQECLEDDSTGKGSASRLVLLLGTVALCVALVGVVAAGCFLARDLSAVAQTLCLALGAGGAGPYTCKRVMEAFRGPAPVIPPAPGGDA